MVIDSSALVAIFLNEPERRRFLELLAQADHKLLSAASVVESGIVLETRAGPAIARELDLFLHEADIEIVSLDEVQADRARMAYRKFGKGNHPAGLNFGDCFSHALAVVSGESILAKGQEFALAGLEVLS
jgi:ribonuclease VapC